MDARVSANFYRVSTPANSASGFVDQLREAAAPPSARLRQRDIGANITVRIERFRENAEFVEGEFSRIQITNIPAQTSDDGLIPTILSDGSGLAHVAAFVYHPQTRVLLLQRNMLSVTPNRLMLYLCGADPSRMLAFSPVMTEDAIARFQAGHARSFTVKFAGIDNLTGLDDQDTAAAQGARMIGEAYHGADVTITVSVGRRRGAMLRGFVERDVERLATAPGVETLEAKLIGEANPIDLLSENMRVAMELALPEHDPIANYEIRVNFLRDQLQQAMQTLRHRYG
jgi:hypothetical protein